MNDPITWGTITVRKMHHLPKEEFIAMWRSAALAVNGVERNQGVEWKMRKR